MLQATNNNQHQRDTFYEIICQVKEMLDTDRRIGDIVKYLSSITGKESYGIPEIYALAYCYDFMESIQNSTEISNQ